MNAIGLIELNSVARGIEAWDFMLKAASVKLLTATSLCPGKYAILIGGDVGAVKTSMETGIEHSGPWLIDSLIIPNIHPEVFPALTSCMEADIQSLGTIETFTVASAILSADAAVKASSVHLLEIRIAMGLGGKSTIYLTGEVGAVEAAVEAGKKAVKPDMVVDCNVIPSPHTSLIKELLE